MLWTEDWRNAVLHFNKPSRMILWKAFKNIIAFFSSDCDSLNLQYTFIMLSVPLRPPADLTGNTNAHGGFRYLDVQQDVSRNAWNTLKDIRNHDASMDCSHSLNQRNPKKYLPGVLCKSEKIQPSSTCGLWSTSEQNQTWGKEPPAHQKPTLRSIVSPLNAHRLKPIRQKTKNAVVRISS